MPRRVKDRVLDTREARTKLKARGKPYYRLIDKGLHLGYRKLSKGAGVWVARFYAGEQEYEVKTFATADDLSDSNHIDVLDFSEAQSKARKLRDERSRASIGAGPYTVNDAMEAYIQYLEDKRKTAKDARYRHEAHIKPVLGDIDLASLRADQIRAWQAKLAKTSKRVRTAKGEEQQHGQLKDEESRRRRKVDANRMLITLKAALNMAFRDDKVASNVEWRKVQPFKGVDVPRVRYLE